MPGGSHKNGWCQWQGTLTKWRASWKNSCSTVAPPANTVSLAMVRAYSAMMATAATSQAQIGTRIGSTASMVWTSRWITSFVGCRSDSMIMVMKRERLPHLVLVAGESNAISAHITVHPRVAGHGLVVPVEHETGQARIRTELGPHPHGDVGMGGRPGRCLFVDPVDQHAGEQEVGHDRDVLGAQEPASIQRLGHRRRGQRNEGGLDRGQPATLPKEPGHLEEVSVGVRIRRASADYHDRPLAGRLVDGFGDALGGHVENGRVDPEVAPVGEAD